MMNSDLARERAALVMVQDEPFNAEAPPEALLQPITPTGMHFVRSNFALPEHDGMLTIGGAVAQAVTLTLDDLRAMPPVERAVTLECAGNARLDMKPMPVGEPWGGYAVSTAQWKGALLHQVSGHGATRRDRDRTGLRRRRSWTVLRLSRHALRPVAGDEPRDGPRCRDPRRL